MTLNVAVLTGKLPHDGRDGGDPEDRGRQGVGCGRRPLVVSSQTLHRRITISFCGRLERPNCLALHIDHCRDGARRFAPGDYPA